MSHYEKSLFVNRLLFRFRSNIGPKFKQDVSICQGDNSYYGGEDEILKVEPVRNFDFL